MSRTRVCVCVCARVRYVCMRICMRVHLEAHSATYGTIANANMFAPADARCHLVNQRELTLSFEADSLPRGNAVYRFLELLPN